MPYSDLDGLDKDALIALWRTKYAEWITKMNPHVVNDHPDAAACLSGACTETISSKEPNRAMYVVCWTIHTGDWPRMAQVGQLDAEYEDMEMAVRFGVVSIRDETFPMLHYDPQNETLKAMQDRWVTLSPAFEGRLTEIGSRSHVFYECMRKLRLRTPRRFSPIHLRIPFRRSRSEGP